MAKPVFTYKITADDYLTHQLFSASLNNVVKQQRRRGMILWTSAFFILALIFYIQKNTWLAVYFSLFGIGFIFIYPVYSRWIYKRYYKRFVNRNFKESELNNLLLKIEDNALTISNGGGEGRVPVSDIIKIYEIPTHIFFKLNEGKNIIVPRYKVENKEELQNKINHLIQVNNIEFIKFPSWKWK